MTGLLDQAALDQAFARLAELLSRRRVVGHVYIVGGAAMIMAYHAERATRDVDALILEGHGPVMDAARQWQARSAFPTHG